MAELIPDDEVAARLERMPGWTRDGDAIRKAFRFETFPEAVAFVARVAAIAEDVQHHPDIDIRYRTVMLQLSTWSASGITDRDFDLAARADAAAVAEIPGVTG